MSAGMLIAALGLGLLTQVGVESGLAIIVIAMLIISLGFSPVFTLATDMMIGSAPPERAGAASAIAETNAEFGGALGIAILGSLGTAIYRSEVTDTLPLGVPAESVETVRGTLGGAHGIAADLQEPLATQVLDAAKFAFVDSIEVTFAICALLALGTSVLVALMLRNVVPSPQDDAVIEMHPDFAYAESRAD
jgi:DHA2 family multidrug resistance protein-like MFS transporter